MSVRPFRSASLGLLGLLTFLLALCAPATASTISAAAALDARTASAAVVAPERGCPSRIKLDAPAAIQERAMLCLVNEVREQYGKPPLEAVEALQQSAGEKAGDVLGCDSFSHEACGREFSYWIRETGYLAAECWRAGENLAWGTGEYGTVGSIFRAWMRSDTHRENILGDYTQTGIALEVGRLGNLDGVRVWAEHFGSQECRTGGA